MNPLDNILNQITKFSGAPAKFSGATRPMRVQVVFNPALVNLDTFQDSLLALLDNYGWNVVGDQINSSPVSSYGNDRQLADFYANVSNDILSWQVESAIRDIFKQMNISVDIVSIEDNGQPAPAPFSSPGNIYTSPTPTQTPLQAGPLMQPPTSNAVVKSNTAASSQSSFNKLFFDNAGKISAVGIGILLVVGIVAVTSSQQHK